MFKVFNLLLLKKKSIVFISCVKISKQYLGYYAKYSLFNSKGSKSEILGSSLHFSEVILISFVMLNNEKRHFVMTFTVG